MKSLLFPVLHRLTHKQVVAACFGFYLGMFCSAALLPSAKFGLFISQMRPQIDDEPVIFDISSPQGVEESACCRLAMHATSEQSAR